MRSRLPAPPGASTARRRRPREPPGACPRESRRRVAVVGAGVSGLTAAYLLQRAYDVTLYEAEPRLGGHAHTHDVVTPDGRLLPIDSGFIVHNLSTYPNLLRLFGELGVETQPTDMSMSVRCDGCGLEYAGAQGLGGVFAQPANAANPRFLRMLVEVKRFHRTRPALLDSPEPTPTRVLTLGDFLDDGRSTRVLRAATSWCRWCRACGRARRGPRCCTRPLAVQLPRPPRRARRHGSPQLAHRGRRFAQLRRARREGAHRHRAVHAGARRAPGRRPGIEIRDDADDRAPSTHAVVATHADDALALLVEPTAPRARRARRVRLVGQRDGPAHRRLRCCPRDRARPGVVELPPRPVRGRTPAEVHVSYDMNRLHRLDEPVDYVVTLNPGGASHDDARARPDALHAPRVHRGVGRRAGRAPELNDGRSRSPARTTGGASTRTAAPRVCVPPHRWG